jgi:hypothetical protein
MSYGGKIAILPGQSEAEEFSTLVHELAHEMLHKAERRTTTTKVVRETEAEAIAFVIGEAVGLDTGSASADYIQLYHGNASLLIVTYLAFMMRQDSLAHAAPERDGYDRPLIGNGLPLEKMVAGKGHRLLSMDGGRLANALLYGTLPRLCDDTARLIAELCGDLPVCLKHLLFGEILFIFAGGVRGDLRGLRSLKAFRSRCSLIFSERGLDASRYSCEYPLISGAPERPRSSS